MLSRKEKERERERDREQDSDAQNADDAGRGPNTSAVAGLGSSLRRATPPLLPQSPPSGSAIDPLSQVSLLQPGWGLNSPCMLVTRPSLGRLFPRITYGGELACHNGLAPVANHLAVLDLHARCSGRTS